MTSRFRHTNCVLASEDSNLVGITPCDALWDGSNVIACNEKYVAIPWHGQGNIGVFLHENHGKVPNSPPLFHGQGGPIIDCCFDPFNSSRLFSASEDGSIFGWSIPEGGLEENCGTPSVTLLGHTRKCGTVRFHPSCAGVLASAAVDRLVNIWDIENSVAKLQFNQHDDYVTDLSWNLDGSLMCSVAKNKKLHIIDPRGNKFVESVNSHANVRAQRCVWAKRKNIIFTCGWDNTHQREILEWDPRNLKAPLNNVVIDQSSSASMIHFDEDTNLFMLASRGESKIRCYELLEDNSFVHSFNASTTEPAKGFGVFPKSNLSVKECEIGRVYHLTQTKLLTVQMFLPRKNAAEEFQEDVFPPTFSGEPSLTATEYFSGKNAKPKERSMLPIFEASTEKQTTTRVPVKTAQEEKSRAQSQSSPEAPKVPPKQIHADPSNMNPTANKPIIDKRHEKVKALTAKLDKEKAALDELRKAVQQKEMEVFEIIDELKNSLE